MEEMTVPLDMMNVFDSLEVAGLSVGKFRA